MKPYIQGKKQPYAAQMVYNKDWQDWLYADLHQGHPVFANRGNSLRVMPEAVRWGKRGARINTISPGIIITRLAKDELNGPRGDGYRRMIEVSAAGRAGTPDEEGAVSALLMGPDGTFITGSDFLNGWRRYCCILVWRTGSAIKIKCINRLQNQ